MRKLFCNFVAQRCPCARRLPKCWRQKRFYGTPTPPATTIYFSSVFICVGLSPGKRLALTLHQSTSAGCANTRLEGHTLQLPFNARNRSQNGKLGIVE